MNEKLQKLVDEMVERGVRFPEATREFERRFISRVLADSDGNLSKAADALAERIRTAGASAFVVRLDQVNR